MPTYTYACRDCDHRFEMVQSIHDPSLSTCPRCEGTLRKVFEPVGVTFKGSGFYRTDSRSRGKSESSEPSAPASTQPPASSAPASTQPPAPSTPAKSSQE